MIAPTQALSASVIVNFRQVLEAKKLSDKAGQLRLHPIIKRMLGDDILEKMGGKPLSTKTTKKAETKTGKATPKTDKASPKVKTTVKKTKPKTKAKAKAKPKNAR